MIRLFWLLIKLFLKHRDSGIHSIRVAFRMVNYTLILREISEMSVVKSFFYGLFHDIGKLGISNEILSKKGKLTDSEFDIIKTHTTNEYALLANCFFPGIIDHHETMDGKGYAGKLEFEINEYAKLLSIVDVFDALSNKRDYKDAIEYSNVIDIMNIMASNGKFDNGYFQKLLKVV